MVLLEFWLSSMVVGLIGCYGFVGFALWFDVNEVLADLMGVFWGALLDGNLRKLCLSVVVLLAFNLLWWRSFRRT